MSEPSPKRWEQSGDGPLMAVQELTEAWLRQDQAGMSSRLAEDIAEMGPVFRGVLRGKADFFDKYRRYLEGPPEILSYRVIGPRVILLSARFALVYFSYRMRRKGKAQSSRGKESMLLERVRRRWLVKFIHWHEDP